MVKIIATAVAALLATSFAIAQTPGGSGPQEKGSSGSPAREATPPSEKAQKQDAPIQKGSGTADKDAPKEKQKTSEPDPKGAKEGEKKAEPKSTKEDSKAAQSKDKNGSAANDKAAGSKDQPKTGGAKSDTQDKSAASKDQLKSSDTAKDGAKAGAAGKVTISSDQRQKVQTTFAKHKTAARVNVNVDVKIGTRVPREVRLLAIPEDIIVIVPQYRRYKYFVVEETVVIVDPDTFEIVDVLVLA